MWDSSMPCTAGTTLLVWSIGRHLELKSESHYTEEKQTRVIIAIHVVSKMTSTLFLWFNIVIRGASGIATCSTATSTTINRAVEFSPSFPAPHHSHSQPPTLSSVFHSVYFANTLSLPWVWISWTYPAAHHDVANHCCTFIRRQAILKESTKKLGIG